MCTNKEDKKHVVDKSTTTNEWYKAINYQYGCAKCINTLR